MPSFHIWLCRGHHDLVCVTSPVAGYPDAIGTQSQKLGCRESHKQHSLVDKRRNNSFSENITFTKI